MGWTTPVELRAQVQKRWERGELLASLTTGEPVFPLRLPIKAPSSSELADHYEAVRGWIATLQQMRHVRLEMREFRHRILGTNAVPHAVWIDTFDDAVDLLGKRAEAQRFSTIADKTRACAPELVPWLARRALRATELADEWDRLLDIVAWLRLHPRPGIYLRQVDLPGVHTKFFERHRAVLSEMLDLVLAADHFDAQYSGLSQFTLRYGFLDKPRRVRCRALDSTFSFIRGTTGGEDITLDATSFATMDPPASRIIMTENEINFLSLPAMPDTLAIFGGGYGFENLRDARWLSQRRLWYWGDIDTHGFAILDQLRAAFPHAESLLMDRDTLLAFQAQWVTEETPTARELTRLHPDELDLYNDLRDNRLGQQIRLEQERVGFGYVIRALDERTR